MMSFRLKVQSIITLPFVRNTLKLSSSSVILMFLPLLVTPILSRLYTPADYGDWGVFSSVLYIVSSFVFLSYENTIVKTNTDKEVPNLVALCLLVLFGISLLVLVVFGLGNMAGIGFFTTFPRFSLLIPVIILSALYTLASNLANRRKKYNAMAMTNIVNGVSQALFRILLGFFPIISYGLIVGNLIAQFLASTILILWVGSVFRKGNFKSVSFTGIRGVAKKYKKFPLFDAPARFIEFAIGNLAIIILSFFWSKDEIGCFSMVTQFILIPITIIGSAMANVYYKEISENAQNQTQLVHATLRVGKINFILSILPILFLSLGGDQLLVLFLGDRWDNVAPIALCLVMFSVPVILSEPLLPIFRAQDRQEIRFSVNVFHFFLSLGLLIIMALLTHDLYLSLIVYSGSYSVMRFIMFHEEMKLANVTVMSISRYYGIVIIGCYFLLGIRLIGVIL